MGITNTNTINQEFLGVEQQIHKYYSDNRHLFESVDHKFRQLRLQLRDSFFTVRDRTNIADHLLRHNPLGVYSTIGKWMNPTVLRKIKRSKTDLDEKKVRMNPLIRSDYVVDIDLPFTEHRQIFVDCAEYLGSTGLNEWTLKFSGANAQILIKDFYVPTIADPVQRLLECKKRFEDFTDELLDQGFPVDFGVQSDWPTRVAKVIPHTISPHGTIVEDVPIENIWGFEPRKVVDVPRKVQNRILSRRQKMLDGSVRYLKCS